MSTPLDSQLLAALRDGPVGWGLFDPQERLVSANPAFLAAFATALAGQPSWEALMRHCHAKKQGLKIDTDDIDAG